MSATYKIRVKGHLDQQWLDNWATELIAAPQDNGDTVITGPITDQPALYGLLKKIGQLGLPLLLVEQLSAPPTVIEPDAKN